MTERPSPGQSRSAPASAAAVLLAPAMLGLHLLLVVVLAGTGVAGWWQLEAWRAERADAVAERADRAPVPLETVLGPDAALTGADLGVPVVVEGEYAPRGEQFLVSGRPRPDAADGQTGGTGAGGADGFWVLSPLVVDGTGSSLLVVRGWQPDARALPPVPSGPVRETGQLLPGEEGSGVLSGQRVVAAVRIPALVGETDTDLYGAYLLRTGPARSDPSGTVPVQPPVADPSWSTGLQNLAYSGQWWLFGAFALYLWWRSCAERLAAARTGPSPAG